MDSNNQAGLRTASGKRSRFKEAARSGPEGGHSMGTPARDAARLKATAGGIHGGGSNGHGKPEPTRDAHRINFK
jgi:hypothetical protein